MSEPSDISGPGLPPPVPPTPAGPPAAATPSGAPFLPPTQPFAAPPPPPTVPTSAVGQGEVPEVGLSPAGQSPRRSKGKLIGALAGVVVLLGAGTFAVAQISSNDSSGGAASPKELGDKLMQTLDNEDVLGAVDLLLPGERDTFRQPMIELVDELRRLQILDDSADLHKVGGIDITVEDQNVTVEDTNVDDISHVSISGTSSAKVNGDEVPIGDLVTKLAGGERPDLTSESDSSDFDVTFTAVEKDGRWYVSLFYSLAESMRGDRDIPDEGVSPAGADTPEGALDNMLNAISGLDIEGVIAGLNPNEAEALQRYAPLFIDDAQSALDDANAKVELSGAKYDVTGSGDERQVALTAVTAKVTTDGQSAELSLKDGCVTGKSGDQTFDTCDAQNGVDQTIDDQLSQLGVDDSTDIKTFIDDAQKAFSDFSMHGVVVNKVDGKWYVSPIGTSFELMLSTLRALDRDEIDTLIEDGKKLVESFTSIAGETTSDSGTDDSNTATTDDSGTSTTDDSGTSNTDDSGTSNTDDAGASNSDWYSCLNQPSAEAAKCIDDGVQSGAFDATLIPAPYLYPDCGLFDYYNSEALYSDTPEDFFAQISKGASCIVAAAAADGIDLSSNTPEFVKPECFAKVNPYNASGDPDEYQKAFDCAYAN